MRGYELLNKMELVEAAFIEEADAPAKKRRFVLLKWGAAACLCLVLGGMAAYQMNLFPGVFDTHDASHTVEGVGKGTSIIDEQAEASSIYLNGNQDALYFPISFQERVMYGLVPDGAEGLTPENTYQITEQDLGETMGTVTGGGESELNGCTAYHFARYPELDSICIVDTPQGYAFYVCGGLWVETMPGELSDKILEAYGLPDALARMEIQAPDFTYLFDIEDTHTIQAVFQILFGKSNSGLEANERRFAQLWYDTWGNEDVYYNEQEGCCAYRTLDAVERAQNLWTEGERVISIINNQGYQLMIDYFPSIRTFICGDGYYELSEEEAQALNTLLNIEG